MPVNPLRIVILGQLPERRVAATRFGGFNPLGHPLAVKGEIQGTLGKPQEKPYSVQSRTTHP